MKGYQITTLAGLKRAADDRRAVVCPGLRCWARPIPAAFVIQQQGPVLLRILDSGLYAYEKEKDDATQPGTD